MGQGLIQFINRLATGRNVIFMILIWLAYAIFIMGSVGTMSSSNVGPIDLTFAPSPEKICRMIDVYGPDARQDYMWAEIIWDGFYPIIYGVMLLMGLSYVLHRAGINFAHRNILLFLPFLVVGADYGENAIIVTLLSSYPSCSVVLATLAGIFVTVKWVMAFLCLSFLIGVYIFMLIRNKKIQ